MTSVGLADIDPARLSLSVDGALVVWCTPMALDVATRLSPTHELKRVARLRMADDRARSLTGAWLLRQVAGAALGVDPYEVAVDRACRCGQPHGRPQVDTQTLNVPAAGGGVDVSVTHSSSVVGVAATRRGRVGLDVEPRKAFTGERSDDVLQTAATPAELAWARSHGDASSGSAGVELAAGRLWVRKEAILKATGHGLAQDPRAVLLDQARGILTGWPFLEPVASVHLFDLDPELVPGSRYLGALALLDPLPLADHSTSVRGPVPVRRPAPPVRVVHVVPPELD